ncbi:hypothetical protein H8959_012708 [Pygathrix nigripes]
MDARGRRAGSRGPTEGTPGRRAASTSAPRVAPPPPAGLGRRSRRREGGLGNPAGEKRPSLPRQRCILGASALGGGHIPARPSSLTVFLSPSSLSKIRIMLGNAGHPCSEFQNLGKEKLAQSPSRIHDKAP